VAVCFEEKVMEQVVEGEWAACGGPSIYFADSTRGQQLRAGLRELCLLSKTLP
jgi:hypothetical protein